MEKTNEEIIEEFNLRFRPTWKKDITKNESIELPTEVLDIVHFMESVSTFLEQALETAEKRTEERIEKLLEYVECEKDC